MTSVRHPRAGAGAEKHRPGGWEARFTKEDNVDKKTQDRFLTGHVDGLGLNDRISIVADEQDHEGGGGASHHYDIVVDVDPSGGLPQLLGELHFQHGARDGGVNGITDQAVLEVLIDRYRGFQQGPFACRENALVLTKLEEAKLWMGARARERATRGVLGKMER